MSTTTEPTSRAILVCGVPASGKTSFGKALARELGWAIFDLDTVTNPLFEYVGGEFLVDVPTAEAPVRASVNDIRYKCLFDTAAENLEVGVNVVIIAPFTSERTFPTAWQTVPERLHVDNERVTLAWVDTPKDEVVARMIKRGADRDLGKIEQPDVFLTPEVTRAPGVPHMRVDGLKDTSTQVTDFAAEYTAVFADA